MLLRSIIIIALLLVGPFAAADVLYLTDGRMLRGEVVAETDLTINFRYQEGGLWTTRTFARAQIAKIEIEEGDQSDQGETSGGGSEQPRRDPPPRRRDPASPHRDGDAPAVARIPLHGHVGSAGGNIAGTFDAAVLVACFEEAQRRGIDTVILDINSPGGLVGEMEAVCDAIIEWHNRLRIIAHTHDAFSAAAIIALCCKEIVVRPDSRIGAATIVERGEQGLSAVDAKFASPHYARQRQYMKRSGHPYELIAAMTIQETELWWSPTIGFTTTPPGAPASGDDWEKVDGASTVLTMTADDALRWGIAMATARTTEQVAASLGLGDSVQVVDLASTVESHIADLDRRMTHLKNQFSAYFDSLAALNQAMRGLFDAQHRNDQPTIQRLKREIPREVQKNRNAGQQILRTDRDLVARRIEVPEVFLQRIEEDGELIAGISRLISSDSTEAWLEAAERLAQVLLRWRDTLDM